MSLTRTSLQDIAQSVLAGDKEHTVEDTESYFEAPEIGKIVDEVYASVITAGLAPSIKSS